MSWLCLGCRHNNSAGLRFCAYCGLAAPSLTPPTPVPPPAWAGAERPARTHRLARPGWLIGAGVAVLVGIVLAGYAIVDSSSAGSSGMDAGGPPFSATSSAPSIAPAPSASTDIGNMERTWNIDIRLADGGSATAALSVGDPHQYRAGLSNGDFVAGSGCQLEPGQDAVVPATLTLLDSGSTSDVLEIGFAGVGDASIPDIVGPVLEWEAGYAEPSCDDNESFGLESSSPMAPAATLSLDGFLDITGYYAVSPAASQAAIVGDSILTLTRQNAPAGVPPYTITDVSGPGVKQTADGWSLDLAGT